MPIQRASLAPCMSYMGLQRRGGDSGRAIHDQVQDVQAFVAIFMVVPVACSTRDTSEQLLNFCKHHRKWTLKTEKPPCFFNILGK
mmetsp:Transcript_9676/g.16042  ORF Transcript_9676/g.16042 Transcript_9676/m.16042 type:complete len:85 (+) Transcript_9676:334-588(+)